MKAKTTETPTRQPVFAAPHVYVLALVGGPDSSGAHRIVQHETVIGRGDDVEFRLDDDQVSNRHCAIRVDGPVCALVELGSLNGTRINDRIIRSGTSERLRHLDLIQIGETKMLLLAGKVMQKTGKG